MGLTARLRCALLFSSSNKRTVIHINRILASLLVVAETLWTFEFLNLSERLVVIVTLEKLLDTRSLQLSLMLKHLLGVGILPLAIGILSIEVIFILRGLERRLYALFYQGFPVKVGKPFVLLDNMRTLLAKAVGWFALDELIDQISSLM